MRLSEWRAVAPARPAVDPKVLAVVQPVLESLGAGTDPHCWVVWGDDVTSRWHLLVPTMPGLLVVYVRVNVSGEGPRASAKLVRWSRVQVGELAIETQGGHRILTFSVENAILKGVDADADRVGSFALGIVNAIDGRMTDVETFFGAAVGGRPARGVGPTPAKGAAARRSGTRATGPITPACRRVTSSATPATAAAKAIPATTGSGSPARRAGRAGPG